MSRSDGCSTTDFQQKIDATIEVTDLEQWAQRMTGEMLKNLKPGDAVEMKINIDFKGDSKSLSQSQKNRLMDKILKHF